MYSRDIHDEKAKPYLLTWDVFHSKGKLMLEYRHSLKTDKYYGFKQYTYKWLALELTLKK